VCLFLPKCNKHHDQNVRTPTQSFRLLFSASQKSKLSPVKRAFLPDAVGDGASMPKSIKILIWISWAQWAVWSNSAVLIIFIVFILAFSTFGGDVQKNLLLSSWILNRHNCVASKGNCGAANHRNLLVLTAEHKELARTSPRWQCYITKRAWGHWLCTWLSTVIHITQRCVYRPFWMWLHISARGFWRNELDRFHVLLLLPIKRFILMLLAHPRSLLLKMALTTFLFTNQTLVSVSSHMHKSINES